MSSIYHTSQNNHFIPLLYITDHLDHSIILLVLTLLIGPDTVGRHQQWEVPAPTFTFIPKSYTHFMPTHNFTCHRRSFWSLSAQNMCVREFKLWTCNNNLLEKVSYTINSCYTVDHINYCCSIFVGNKYPFIHLFIYLHRYYIRAGSNTDKSEPYPE